MVDSASDPRYLLLQQLSLAQKLGNKQGVIQFSLHLCNHGYLNDALDKYLQSVVHCFQKWEAQIVSSPWDICTGDEK